MVKVEAAHTASGSRDTLNKAADVPVLTAVEADCNPGERGPISTPTPYTLTAETDGLNIGLRAKVWILEFTRCSNSRLDGWETIEDNTTK